ncbi:MAG: GH36 C-terminal domain-containing protein [Firmicutes bacterium]|nr:GH36 C-terminal domain-containing protein [Bacillota bacterium]
MEYPCYGSADLITPAFHAEYENGSSITKLEYERHKIFDGKKAISGLPATYVDNENEAQTLEITLVDRLTGLKIILSYTTFARCSLGKTCVKLHGLCETAKYTDKETGKVYSGSYLMNVGLCFENNKDFESKVIVLQICSYNNMEKIDGFL